MKFALEFGEPLCRTRRQLLRSDLQQYGPFSLTRLIEAITRITSGSVGRLGLVGITLRTREGALGTCDLGSEREDGGFRPRPLSLKRSEERRVGKGVSVRLDIGGRRII